MSTNFLYNISLVLHITGLTLMAGTTVADSILYRQFWKQYNSNPIQSTGTLQASGKLAVLFGLGFLLLLASGITIMALTHGLYGEQLWFRVKMVLVVAILVNGLAVGRRTGLAIRKAVIQASGNVTLSALRRRLALFHFLQLVLFIAIYIMGVFKFN
jgi:hypothetical protein